MGWRDLLQAPGETFVSPWVGGRSLPSDSQVFKIEGRLPPEHGWYEFELDGRKARFRKEAEPEPEKLKNERVQGYLVGDRVLADGVRVEFNLKAITKQSQKVHFIEDGLDRFVRITAVRAYEDGPFVYSHQEMPLGPEDDVLGAFLDGEATTVDHLPGVAPALDAAFRMEVWRRAEAARRRAEEEERRRKEEEERQREARRQQLIEQLGDAQGRREMAQHDFGEAARAALKVGGATYLDHRKMQGRQEMAVKFRLGGERFECTCDEQTLRIIDSGICLTDHRTGESGDTRFTLESLPGVIQQAQDTGVLHVYRHV